MGRREINKELRIQYIQRYVQLIKQQKMVSILVQQIVLFKALGHLARLAQDRFLVMKRFFSSVFMAIKFKINFHLHYKIKYGLDQGFRNQNIVRRAITLVAGASYDGKMIRSNRVVKKFTF